MSPYLKETEQQTILLIHNIKAAVWKMPGMHRKIYLLILERALEGQGSLGEFSRTKELSGTFPSPPPPSLDTWTPMGTSRNTQLANSIPHPCAPLKIHPLKSTIRSSPKQLQVSSHSRPAETLLQQMPTPIFSYGLAPSNLPIGVHPKGHQKPDIAKAAMTVSRAIPK